MKPFRLTLIQRADRLIPLALFLGTGVTALAEDQRAPEVPTDIAVPAGNKVHFHGFGMGVQIYTWDGSNFSSERPTID